MPYRWKLESMICVTVGRTRHKHTIAEHQRLGELGAELVELRLDYIGRAIDLARLLNDRPTPVIVTCRRKEDGGRWDRTEEERQMLLRSAIAMGVEYVDLEEDTAAKIPRYGKTKRIVSTHNFEQTPEDLDSIVTRLAKQDADIVKIATMANSFADTIRMLRLMENATVPLIGICMGEVGTLSRVLARRYGAPFTYCSISSERRLAPGQLTFDQMKNLYRADEIDESTKLYGVIADPVAHSYSPLLHNAAFAAHGLNARYIPFRVTPEDLSLFIQWAKQSSVGGLSVTIPHKEAVLPMLDHAESSCQGLGAVNTIVFDDGEAVGYNTDYRAALDCLTDAMSKISSEQELFRGRAVLLLGAGGVSRAIGYGLRQRGAIVAIASRSFERSVALAKSIGARAIPWDARYDIKPAIIVNGTPIGMFPSVDDTPYDAGWLNDQTLVFDTVYNPNPTLLLKSAIAKGCSTINGTDMFIRQAAYQYRLFTGIEAPIEAMQSALQKAISPINY